MTQATDCATDFEVTDEMRARHAAWVDEYVAAIFDSWRSEGQVDRDPELANRAIALVRSELNVTTRTAWMHPLRAMAVKAMGEPLEPPVGERRVDHFDCMRTMEGMSKHQRLYWVARAAGVGMSQARQYDLDRETHDLSGPSCLYRFYDADGALLYVGITKDPTKRTREHSKRSEWHPFARSRTLEWFEDRESALDAERAAIHRERPLFNRLGARSRLPEYTPALF